MPTCLPAFTMTLLKTLQKIPKVAMKFGVVTWLFCNNWAQSISLGTIDRSMARCMGLPLTLTIVRWIPLKVALGKEIIHLLRVVGDQTTSNWIQCTRRHFGIHCLRSIFSSSAFTSSLSSSVIQRSRFLLRIDAPENMLYNVMKRRRRGWSRRWPSLPISQSGIIIILKQSASIQCIVLLQPRRMGIGFSREISWSDYCYVQCYLPGPATGKIVQV